MAPIKLTYFAIKGLAEPIRLILAYSGEEYVDERIKKEEWPALKPKTPFGKLPYVEIDGKVANQSRAIARYFAKKAGLAGKDDWEALLIDSTVDTIDDFKSGISSYNYDPDESSKAKKYDVLVKETVPFYLERFEKQVKDNGGYFVNGKLSWAEFYFVGLLDGWNTSLKMDVLEKSPALRALRDKVLALPAIKAYIAKRPETPF